MGTHRNHSREFKLDVCRKAESGEVSKSKLCRDHGLSGSLLDRWIDQYRAKGEESFTGGAWRPATQEPEAKIRALESSLGRAHLEIEFLRETLGKLGLKPRKSEN
jgi:transposase-like protein